MPLLNYAVIEQSVSKARPPPLLSRVLWGGAFQARNFKFLRNVLNEGINQSNFKDPLKLIALIPLLHYAVI